MEPKYFIVTHEGTLRHLILLDAKYWDSGPNYFDRRRNYFSLKDAYHKLDEEIRSEQLSRGRQLPFEVFFGLGLECATDDFMGRKQEYQRSFCEEYWVSGPSHLDRRRSYLAVKNEYLDARRDCLERKDYSMRSLRLMRPGLDFGINEAEFLSIEQRFLAVKKDFMALKEDYQTSFEKDIDRMREFFLGSKRDELTPSLGPDFFTHDVFLSFRGKDVRGTLADHLSQSLSKAGLRVFLDSNSLKKGAKIWPSLKRAIEKSAICIPIYSEGYADSTWCLKESATMLETPHLIIPLFYGVDPSDVRHPLNKKSPYKRSFEKHYGHPDRHPQGEIDGWKSALGEICSRSGWTMGVTQDCHVAVEGIVKDVIDILRSQEK